MLVFLCCHSKSHDLLKSCKLVAGESLLRDFCIEMLDKNLKKNFFCAWLFFISHAATCENFILAIEGRLTEFASI